MSRTEYVARLIFGAMLSLGGMAIAIAMDMPAPTITGGLIGLITAVAFTATEVWVRLEKGHKHIK
jgi:hypothetical protein